MNLYLSLGHRISGTWLLVVLAAWTSLSETASGQVTQSDFVTSNRAQGGTRFTIHLPAKSPQPPWMKVSLLPPAHQLQPGNAAPLYYRAVLSASQNQNGSTDSKEFWELHDQWMSTPLAELPVDEIEKQLFAFDRALEETGHAARRSYCEWDFPLKESKTEILNVRLDEVQECRTLAQLLGLRIRLRMAQGRFDEAVADLQSGFALARNVGSRGFTVNHMVGQAIAMQMYDLVLELSTLDASPNLYWTISSLPDPLIDPQTAIRQERMTLRIMFPEMYEALESTALLDDTYWDDQLRSFVNRWVEIGPPKFGNPGTTERLLQDLAWQGFAYSQAPRLKRELVEEFGYPQGVVDAMPDARALLLQGALRSEEKLDTLFAPLALPYYEAEKFYQQQRREFPPSTIFTPQAAADEWLSSFIQFHGNIARSQELYQMLRIVESLRDYAAKHGKLPEKLDELTDLPVAPSPVTGKPFDYQRNESDHRVGTLNSGYRHYQKSFEIHVRP